MAECIISFSRFKKPKIAPRIKPRIKPKKRDRFQVAGLLRKGGTVKRKIPSRNSQLKRANGTNGFDPQCSGAFKSPALKKD